MGPEQSRRKDDASFLKTHHVLASFLAIFVGVTAYVFTTFAQIQFVKDQDSQIRHEMLTQREQLSQQNARIENQVEEVKRLVIELLRKERRERYGN